MQLSTYSVSIGFITNSKYYDIGVVVNTNGDIQKIHAVTGPMFFNNFNNLTGQNIRKLEELLIENNVKQMLRIRH